MTRRELLSGILSMMHRPDDHGATKNPSRCGIPGMSGNIVDLHYLGYGLEFHDTNG